MLLFLSILCLLSPIAFFALLIGKRKKPVRAPQSDKQQKKGVYTLERGLNARHRAMIHQGNNLKATPKPRPVELDEIEDDFYGKQALNGFIRVKWDKEKE